MHDPKVIPAISVGVDQYDLIQRELNKYREAGYQVAHPFLYRLGNNLVLKSGAFSSEPGAIHLVPLDPPEGRHEG